MTTPTLNPTQHSLQAADGTTISYLTLGTGPGLVLVPGSMGSAPDYLSLAQNLANSYTVHIVDRRGHGQSGPIKPDHSMTTEQQDIQAVVKTTGAPYLFGHSIGGLISLEAALGASLKKLAVYEPPVSVNGSIPRGWLPDMEQALAAKHYATAMTTIMKGLQLSSDAGALPKPALIALMAVMMRLRKTADGQPWGQHIQQLLPTMPVDIDLVYELDSAYSTFAAVTIPTLLLGGTKSAPHFKLGLETLQKTLPQANLIMMPNLEHNAPNTDAPEKVAAQLRKFLV
ncbi:MAG TPA: alpha/beta hydrolase [Candidatus Saccharimonadia bacterium]|nr:alpha/beta hydrolase [Candidatus Saccharimonadia bacterium]